MNSNMGRLPVRARKDHIVNKIKMNRVTLIVADTGSGKSSQVPQFLLEESLEPILCTQPRRLAVVSIAKMVAEARGCEVGEEVGYHIGQLKLMTSRSKIIFKTAGVLLEELRGEGLSALLRYKVVILDEVHERSVESDLVLTCIKQFMLRNNKIRLVLMSATADIGRYRDYFKDLGRNESVEVIALPSPQVQALFQCRVMYLEQVVELLGCNSEQLSVLESFDESLHNSGVDMGAGVQNLIRDLIIYIHEEEPDLQKSILVFLPTYKSLEQQWLLLKRSGRCLKVHVLHSSIDVEQCARAMQNCNSYRKVILATNIAESSVTIPGVSFVVDSCRSLEIFWNGNSKRDASRLVWVSKSQADQRKGRTGRTCDGQVFRLVPRFLFESFDKYEKPAMLQLSLRKQVLMINCAESKAMSDPRVLFQKALDPPHQETIEDALDMLVALNALKAPSNHRQKYKPTLYGRLLGSLPLSFEASMLVVKFGQCGLLREGALIGSLMDARPMPIVQPFGQQYLFDEYVESYYKDVDGIAGSSQKAIILMANLCAVEFWQRTFKDKHRLERLIQVARKQSYAMPSYLSSSLTPKLEQEWCCFHHVVQSSLHAVAETYEVVMGIMHRFRPKFLGLLEGPPSYYSDYEFKHTCILCPGETDGNLSMFTVDNETAGAVCMDMCVKAPYVHSGSFHPFGIGKLLMNIITEIRTQSAQLNYVSFVEEDYTNFPITTAPLCKFFIKGLCNRGSDCLFSHSHYDRLEPCRRYLTLEGCHHGDDCWFSHDFKPPNVLDYQRSVDFEDKIPPAGSLLQHLWKVNNDQKSILLFGESDFTFASDIAQQYEANKVIVSTMKSESDCRNKGSPVCMRIDQLHLLGVKILWNIDPIKFLRCANENNKVPWSKVQCILWTATFSGKDEEFEMQKELLQNFFEFLAITFVTEELFDVQVILTMLNSKYAQLQVERIARDRFFFLSTSIPFDEATSECFPSIKENGIPTTKPITYIFELLPPSDILFGDYCYSIEMGLRS